VSFAAMIFLWGINGVAKGVAYFIADFTYQGCVYSVMGLTFFAASLVTFDKINRVQDLVQSWLLSRGEAAAAAAGVAQLLGGRKVDEVLTLARSHFFSVLANKLNKVDMAENVPNPALRQHVKSARLGSVDAFLSHSWTDCAELKWAALQEWIAGFKEKNQGKEPSLWIDKYCIDQTNIDDSLACLPVFLAGCKKLLILCGKTYLSRLWCLVEIMVFIEMGGDVTNLEVKLLEEPDNPADPPVKIEYFIEAFDPRNAKCFKDYDTERLLGIIEVIGHDKIISLVHEVFG